MLRQTRSWAPFKLAESYTMFAVLSFTTLLRDLSLGTRMMLVTARESGALCKQFTAGKTKLPAVE